MFNHVNHEASHHMIQALSMTDEGSTVRRVHARGHLRRKVMELQGAGCAARRVPDHERAEALEILR